MSFVFSHGYYLFLGLDKEHWLAIERELTDAKTAPKEQKVSSPSSEFSHPSPRASTSKDDEEAGDEQEAKHTKKQPKKTKTSMNVLSRESSVDYIVPVTSSSDLSYSPRVKSSACIGSPQQRDANYWGPATLPLPMRDRPPHRGLRPLLFTNSVHVWVRIL